MQQGLFSTNQQGPSGRSRFGKDTSFPGSKSCALPECTSKIKTLFNTTPDKQHCRIVDWLLIRPYVVKLVQFDERIQGSKPCIANQLLRRSG